MRSEIEAFEEVNFNWVRPLASIWSNADVKNTGPNQALVDQLIKRVEKQTRLSADGSLPGGEPLGEVLIGQAGIGKTHFLGVLRNKVWETGGWFVLLDVLGLNDFWRSAALSFLTSLLREMPNGRRQFEAVLAKVARRINVEEQVELAFSMPEIDTRELVDLLVKGLKRIDLDNTLRHQDVFRALSLLRSSDVAASGLAYSWLQGYEADADLRAKLGFLKPPPAPGDLVEGMAWIMSLAGPTVIAVDQIDGIVHGSVHDSHDISPDKSLSHVLASGLLELHDKKRRAKTVITCLQNSWDTLKDELKSFRDRFEPEPTVLVGMNRPEVIRDLIASRVGPAYQAAGFTPPYPTWPFSEAAIASAAAAGMMPRTILMRCDAHRRACIVAEQIAICDNLVEVSPQTAPLPRRSDSPFDLSIAHTKANPAGLIDSRDDSVLGSLLRDAFDIYARQIEPSDDLDVVSKGDPSQKTPPLHGRLTFTDHAQDDRERHYCFRALEQTNAIAFQARLRAALTASGISGRTPDRHLLIVRRSPIPGGAKTKQLVDMFSELGGLLLDPSDDDLRTFAALRTLRDEAVSNGRIEAFEMWLRSEKPLDRTLFFRQAGLAVQTSPTPPSSTTREADNTSRSNAALGSKQAQGRPDKATKTTTATTLRADAFPVGHQTKSGETAWLPLSVLPRHTSIIAGSGSGKTVLLRRLIEEAALARIPAIVVDPNNDLSRLGDAWPERPASFTPEDDEKSKRYRDSVEVVVWTPGIHAGNPLFLSVLPDFAGLEDRDERDQAVEMAAETLGPLAGANNALKRGVLAESLRTFAGSGGGDLGRFISLLEELPETVSAIGSAPKLAAGMADQLHASIATNPLLRAEGPLLDPKLLFYGKDPTKTRISVLNLSGLASDAAREDFVNRLQMTLFSWIKKNPSPTGLLYVIDEAQIFLPSQKRTLSLGSGVRLFAQARKYGLGMIVATQAPKGIDNKIVSNCTTQFFGRQSSPATIGAAQEILSARGGRGDDIGRLKAGEFYFATEGTRAPLQLNTPLCLSFHPANPPSPAEVVEKARRSRGA